MNRSLNVEALFAAALLVAACGAEPMRTPSPPGANGGGSPGVNTPPRDAGSNASQVDAGAAAAMDAGATVVDAGGAGMLDTGASVTPDAGGSENPDATSGGAAPTWSADIVPLLQRCTAYCHPGSYAPMSLANNVGYENLINIRSVQCSDGKMRVVPGDAESSYLINKLTGQGLCGGRQMPPSSPLSAAEIDVFRRWINGGARL